MENQYYSYMLFTSNVGINEKTIRWSNIYYDSDSNYKWIPISKKKSLRVANVIEKILQLEEVVRKSVRYFESNDSIFYELHGLVDFATFERIAEENDLRVNIFLKYGYIDKSGVVHAESILVEEKITVDFLYQKTKSLIDYYSDNSLIKNDLILKDRLLTIKFSSYASSMIVHEIFGHPFEDDYPNTFINNGITFPSFINIYNHFQMNNQNFIGIDDNGNKLMKSQILVKSGKVIDRIRTIRRSSFDRKCMTRMTCIELKKTRVLESATPFFELEVNDLIGACVDVLTSKVYLFPQTIRNTKTKEQYNSKDLVLELSAIDLNKDLIWAGGKTPVYQSYCVKNNTPIVVYTKTPSLIIKNISLRERKDILA